MSRSDVAHYEGLVWWNPLAEEDMASALARIDLEPGARALDIGCGRTELLVRLAEQHGAAVTGVDRSGAALALARSEFDARCPDADVTLLGVDAATLDFESATLDVIGWLGGPFLGGSYPSTVATFARWLRPGGVLLLGYGYWLATPPQAYLDATGLPADALDDEATTHAAWADTGLMLEQELRSSREAWDHFEGTLLKNHEAYAAEHPDDPEVQRMIAEKRRWNEAQQRWGRDVMGFSLYVLRKPREA